MWIHLDMAADVQQPEVTFRIVAPPRELSRLTGEPSLEFRVPYLGRYMWVNNLRITGGGIVQVDGKKQDFTVYTASFLRLADS